MWRWRELRRAGAAAAVVAVAAGCVDPDPPGVAVQKLAADIVFGVEPPAPDTPPANLAPGRYDPDAVTFVPGGADGAVSGGGTAPSSSRFPRRPPVRLPRTRLSAPRVPCPPAALTAFPAVEAGQNVTGPPAEGQYRWKREGTQTLTDLPGLPLPISGFEQRLVRNVTRVSDTEFTFETVQPELSGEVTTISTFRVKTAAPSRSVTPPVAPTVPPPPHVVPEPPSEGPALPVEPPATPTVPGSVRVGDPERGVSLVRLERIDEGGNSSVVEFTPGVLYLPLTVEPGEQYSAVGVDPRTGQVLQHQARVLNRERVDACGEIVDGWAVEATQTFSGQSTATRAYRYIVAPQLGGLIISEEFHVASPQGTTDVVISLAQLEPAPLPAERAGGSR